MQVAHLDLDTLAWLPEPPPRRAPLEQSAQQINRFLQANDGWVIEGCYSDLLALVMSSATEVIFMNLPVALCIDNARKRPWEPHKYKSKAEQDANLNMLVDWIAQYPHREDEFSHTSHMALYNNFAGVKRMIEKNDQFTVR